MTRTASAYIIVALVLGFVVPRVRQGWLVWANPELQRDQVTTFLSAVSGGMMVFTGIVFSLLFVMLQFSSTAYSPHILPMLSRNRTLSHAGGVFTGTFLYSLMALRSVGTAAAGGTPSIVVWVTFGWLLASVYVLLRLVRVFSGLAITDVLEMVAKLGWKELEHNYRPYSAEDSSEAERAMRERPPPEAVASHAIVHDGRPEYVVALDLQKLRALAIASDAFIRVPVAIGDAVTQGTTLAVVHGGGDPLPERELRGTILLDRDRSFEESPKQAMRLLVDIAIRSLSPAINDPTTAVHALDQLEGMLVRLGNSNLEIGRVSDSDGTPRVEFAAPTWDDYLGLALSEIGQFGSSAMQVERRLGALLDHLRENVPEPRRAALDRFAMERQRVLEASMPDAWLRRMALCVDRQGIGHSNGEARHRD